MECNDPDISEEELSSVFETYKKQQLEPVKDYSLFSYSVKKKRRRLKKKSKNGLLTASEIKGHSDESVKVQPLPAELLEKLENNVESSQPEESKRKKKKKKTKIKVTSSVVDSNFIPLEVGSSTNFSLVRLDKKETLSYASTALQFYNDSLYGKRIARVPAETLAQGMKKQQAKKALTKRLK